MTSPEAELQELISRARSLAPEDINGVGSYEHPRFFISASEGRLYIALNDKAGQGQPVSVYWETPNSNTHANEFWVPETLAWMRKVMLLDDIAGV